MQKNKVIIDCDPGYDDAAALIFAARSPELEVVGITCVAGNVEVDKTSENALRLCGLAQCRNIPVTKGMAQPLFGELTTATHVHGKSGLDGADLPSTDLTLHSQHAVDFLIESVMATDGDIILLALGPLTNIAMAILKEPKIILKIPEIVLMGGSMGMGNITPSAEFNIFVDPEAARIVFNSEIPIVMLGLDVTHKAALTSQHIAAIEKHGTPVSERLTAMFRFYLETAANRGENFVPTMHDACVVATVCDSSLLTTQLMHVDIETKGEFTRGRTVCAPGFWHGKAPNVRVGIDFDAERFFQMFVERLK